MKPEGWAEVELGSCATFFKGSGLAKSDLTESGTESCIHYGELFTFYGPVIRQVESKCDQSVKAPRSQRGDVLMPGSDVTPRGLATASAVMVDGVVLGGDVIAIRPAAATLCGPFLAYIIRARKEQVLRLAKGSTVYHIHARDLSGLEIPLPPLAEQQAIAEALSDADALVESLDALIAKKRDMKQAAMQQLLAGGTRLPGFTDEWQKVRLGDFCEIVMGQSPESHFYNADGHGLPLIQGNADIANRRTIERVWTLHAPKRADSGDVLLTVRAPVGAVARASGKVCLGRGVCAVRPSRVTTDFLFHALVFGEPQWSALEQGSTFTAANSRDVAEFVLRVPDNEAEQQAIAEVLSDMDAEIDALVAQREKAELVKQGMMQELLSGRVRLA